MRQVEDSLQRLATHRIDILLIHDVDVWTHGTIAETEKRFSEADREISGYKTQQIFTALVLQLS